MAQNITLMGASYSAVPAVTLPKTGGGTASFTDVTDTTAAAADVASGKYFYTASGVRTQGTNSGGGGGSDAEDGIIERTISGTYTNSRVTTIGAYAFYNCSSLTEASFPNATSIGTSAFYSCTSLTTASFPSVTSIGNSAFYKCASLTTARFPNVTSIGAYAFYSCTRLTTASFPNATSIGSNAFCSCSSLATTSFPSATTISNSAFCYCTSLTTASFPKARLIGTQAFRGCTKLMSLYILASSVATLSSSAFYNTPMSVSTYTGSFGSIYVPASLVSSYQTATNWKSFSARITSYV